MYESGKFTDRQTKLRDEDQIANFLMWLLRIAAPHTYGLEKKSGATAE